MKHSDFEARMAWLIELWPRFHQNATVMGEWWRVFQGEPDAMFHDALKRYIETAQVERAPTIGQIREILTDLRAENSANYLSNDVAPSPNSTHEPPATPATHKLVCDALDLIWTLREFGGVEYRATNCGIIDYEQWVQAGRPQTWCIWTDHIMAAFADSTNSQHLEANLQAIVLALREAVKRAAGGGRPEAPSLPKPEEIAMVAAVERGSVAREQGRTPREFRKIGDWD